MSARLLLVLWLLLGAAVWNGFFDLYISRGAREYLQLEAEYELGHGPEPSMTAVMGDAKHNGIMAASVWGGLITVSGWGTVAVARRKGRT